MKQDYQMRIYQYPNKNSYDWVVEYPDLPGCIGAGKTIEEAISEAQINKELWLETAEEMGDKIPMPSDSFAIDYSGKFNIRIPKSLHRDLSLKAEEDGVSLNALCTSLLARGVSNLSYSNETSANRIIATTTQQVYIPQESWSDSKKIVNFKVSALGRSC